MLFQENLEKQKSGKQIFKEILLYGGMIMTFFPFSGPYMFPNIDPIAFSLGPLVIRWYALAYIAGFVATLLLASFFNGWREKPLKKECFFEVFSWGVWGVILGGRLGYVLFYNPFYFATHPLDIFAIWQGGMSFHGGAIGLFVGVWLYCRRRGIEFWCMYDLICLAVPCALFFGRLANFANGELWGRPISASSSISWAVIFPHVDAQPRHPSQLYEALLEGIVLFLLLLLAVRLFGLLRFRGGVTGLFLMGYASMRFTVEFFREPDAHLGLLFGLISQGQLLSSLFFVCGVIFLARALRAGPEARGGACGLRP